MNGFLKCTFTQCSCVKYPGHFVTETGHRIPIKIIDRKCTLCGGTGAITHSWTIEWDQKEGANAEDGEGQEGVEDTGRQ